MTTTNLYAPKQPYTLQKPPPPVGYWVLYAKANSSTAFAMYHKPTDEQIKNTEQLLGWKWKESP